MTSSRAEEFYLRARAGQLLWLSATEPEQRRLTRANILQRNWLSCALADVVFVPFSEKGAKSLDAVRKTAVAGIPVFTCQYDPDPAADVNRDLFALGVPAYSRRTVGKYLESLGATRDASPPFLPPVPENAPPALPAPPRPVRRAGPRQPLLL